MATATITKKERWYRSKWFWVPALIMALIYACGNHQGGSSPGPKQQVQICASLAEQQLIDQQDNNMSDYTTTHQEYQADCT